MIKYSQKEIDEFSEKISKMSHFDLCYLWRFGDKDVPGGSPLLRNDLTTSSGKSLGAIFSDRLFNHFDGFTPEISKRLGW